MSTRILKIRDLPTQKERRDLKRRLKKKQKKHTIFKIINIIK